MRQFGAAGVGIRLQISHRCHQEAGHAERALEALFIDYALLDRMQGSVRAGQSFDGLDSPAAHRVGEHRARVVRHVVDKDGTGATFGAVAAQLGAGEAKFIAQRPRQGLLLHHIDSPLLAIHVESDEPLAHAIGGLLSEKSGGAEQIVR